MSGSKAARERWSAQSHEFHENVSLLKGLKKWSPQQADYYRQLFLCDRGLDLEQAMLMRAVFDHQAVGAIAEKACNQIINLQRLAKHVPSRSRVAIDALRDRDRAGVIAIAASAPYAPWRTPRPSPGAESP